MKTCVKCGKEAYVVNKEGECYNCMGEVDKKIADMQYQKLKAQIEGNSGNNSEKSLEEQLEEEKTLREDYESKLRIIAEQTFERKKKELNAPDWIKSPSALNQWIKSEEEKSGSGTLSLRPEDLQREKGGSGQKEFDSEQEMIDYLRSEAQKGNLEAKKNLDTLWNKVLKGLASDPQKTLNFSFKDPFTPNPETGEPESCIKKKIRLENEKIRKRD